MSQNPKSPFESSTSTSPSDRQAAPPQVGDLYQANKAASKQLIDDQSRMPALGMPTVPKYKPSGGVGMLGLPLMLLTLVALPVVGAYLYNTLGHFGGMLVFSPLILGILMGFAMYPAIQFGKVRNIFFSAMVGALIGLGAVAGIMALEALPYRPLLVQSDIDTLVKTRGVQPQKAKAMVEAYYTPLNTVKTYWEDRAAMGVTLTSSRSRTSSQVSGNMFWVLKGLELILVTVTVMGFAVVFTNRRYSEEFNKWYNSKLLGSVHGAVFETLWDAAQRRDFNRMRECIGSDKSSSQVGAQLNVIYLPEKPGGWLTISAKVHKNKGLEPIYEQELSNEEMKALWPAFPMPNSG